MGPTTMRDHNVRVAVILLTVSQFLMGVVMSQGLASKRCEFMNSSMAICTDKFLISAQLDGLPLGLRVLSLDRNQINVLENNVFWVSAGDYYGCYQ